MESPAAKSKARPFIVLAVLGAIAAVFAFFYAGYKKTHVSTDDAFIEGRVHIVASKVPGTVKAVHATDNKLVKQGDLLIEIDPLDYQTRVEGTRVGVDAEREKLAEDEARIVVLGKQLDEIIASAASARASLELQKTLLAQAENDMQRAVSLVKSGSISEERHEKVLTARNTALLQVKAAEEALKRSETSIESHRAIIRQAELALKRQRSMIRSREIQLKEAELQHSYTRILAPAEGLVTKRSVESGNQIQAGRPLMAVVSLDDIWVMANYKETQLTDIRPGMRVEFTVDAYPDKHFKGTVDSIMAGTGAAFSLFPPENATGNFVKVVQRVPVKIRIEQGQDPGHILRMGMSVIPTVLIKGE